MSNFNIPSISVDSIKLGNNLVTQTGNSIYFDNATLYCKEIHDPTDTYIINLTNGMVITNQFNYLSLDWYNRILWSNDGNKAINWNLRQLSGSWSANTLPTTSGDLVNKGYLDYGNTITNYNMTATLLPTGLTFSRVGKDRPMHPADNNFVWFQDKFNLSSSY